VGSQYEISVILEMTHADGQTTYLDKHPHHLSLCPHFCDVKPRNHVYLPQLQYHIPHSPVHGPGENYETKMTLSGMPENGDSSHETQKPMGTASGSIKQK
jgi:hypothetical protein